MEMAQNPVLIKRKEQIFKNKELKKFNVRYESELTDEERKRYHKIIDKNVGASVRQKLKDKNSRMSESTKNLKLMDKDELKEMPKINQFSNGFGLFDKSKCLDIYKTVQVDGLNMYELRSKRVMIKFKLDKKIIEQ